MRWGRVAGVVLTLALLVGPASASVVPVATAGAVQVATAAAPAGAPAHRAEKVFCGGVFKRGTVSYECENEAGKRDTAFEDMMRSQMMTPDEARAAGCRPLRWDDSSTVSDPMDPYQETPTYPPRTPDPQVTARVNAAWDRIERWLGAHASATLRKLRFPAEGLPFWEHDEARLPDDLYASLLRHDGADGNFGAGFQLPGGYGLATLSDYGDMRDRNCHDLIMSGSSADADPGNGKWHGSLLPFAADGSGHELFINPRDGRVGEKAWEETVRYDGAMAWPSYLALLEAVATALESGGAIREWHPVVTSGCELRWEAKPATSTPAATTPAASMPAAARPAGALPVAARPAGALPAGCAGGPRPSPTPSPTPEAEELFVELRETGCRPAERAPVVRSPDAQVSARVGAVWRRIERWLAKHAPMTYGTLNGPASAVAIAKAEAAMGARFPDDLRASLLRHNGVRGGDGFGPAPFYSLMSVGDVRREWKGLCQTLIDEDAYGWWDGHLIPFAGASDGGNLFVDPRTGSTGEFFHEDGLATTGDVAWPSYLALLAATAEALETGKPIRGWRARVVFGTLDWVEA